MRRREFITLLGGSDTAWFVNNAGRRHRVRPADPFEIAADTGQRCPATPLPHYALIRLGRYNQMQKILVPQPYSMGDLANLTEQQAEFMWDSFVSHISHGVRDEFNQTN